MRLPRPQGKLPLAMAVLEQILRLRCASLRMTDWIPAPLGTSFAGMTKPYNKLWGWFICGILYWGMEFNFYAV
jgi:hypothetical protein